MTAVCWLGVIDPKVRKNSLGQTIGKIGSTTAFLTPPTQQQYTISLGFVCLSTLLLSPGAALGKQSAQSFLLRFFFSFPTFLAIKNTFPWPQTRQTVLGLLSLAFAPFLHIQFLDGWWCRPWAMEGFAANLVGLDKVVGALKPGVWV